ncbi:MULTISPECIES: helix-turn-helix transcriptional regulator [Streptomyces]|uniref:LuxR family transcriptional regulator n=2 Tax=Streptomyces flaveolus TaxID=67297 RepID=A0ABV3AKM0_9ACTN|nr:MULTISPECIES: LuxR family transcriptional regulator [Streptomyces]KMS86564.1 hypothetical protein ACZ91_36400 [Streptomyces regensis]KOG60240.1 hypothetical protein ADK77_36600 [Streptomyces antibioticus]
MTTTSLPYRGTWAGAAPRPSSAPDSARHADAAGRGGGLDTCWRVLGRAARGQGAAVVVRGEAGTGRGTLLRSVADRAVGSGWRVLRVPGGDARARGAFGAFEPLADELLGLAVGLPDPLRAALRRALRGDPAPDAPSTDAAPRQVLASAARRGPVPVVVDDCHLLEPAPVRAVTLATSRPPGTAVGLMAAIAVGARDPFHGCEVTEVFTRLGATPWQESARAALRAVGVSLPGPGAVPHRDPGRSALTAHELRIVRRAARGLSDQEIADQLAVSPRTVASHLYKVFPRLGISSRRELDRASQELGDHT